MNHFYGEKSTELLKKKKSPSIYSQLQKYRFKLNSSEAQIGPYQTCYHSI